MDNRENQLPSRFDARYRINNTGLIKTVSIRPSVLLNSCNSIVSSASAGNLRGKQIISRERNEGLIEAAIRAIRLLSILEEISRRETILFLPPRPKRRALSLSLSKLASCLFSVYRPASVPINKVSRRMGGETLQAFNFTRNVYVKEKRRGAEPQESDPSFLSFFLLLPIHRATTTANPTQSNPAQVQVVTGVFNKVNFKTPARAEINFNAGYRLSPARSGFLTNVGNGCERDASRPLAGK